MLWQGIIPSLLCILQFLLPLFFERVPNTLRNVCALVDFSEQLFLLLIQLLLAIGLLIHLHLLIFFRLAFLTSQFSLRPLFLQHIVLTFA